MVLLQVGNHRPQVRKQTDERFPFVRVERQERAVPAGLKDVGYPLLHFRRHVFVDPCDSRGRRRDVFKLSLRVPGGPARGAARY